MCHIYLSEAISVQSTYFKPTRVRLVTLCETCICLRATQSSKNTILQTPNWGDADTGEKTEQNSLIYTTLHFCVSGPRSSIQYLSVATFSMSTFAQPLSKIQAFTHIIASQKCLILAASCMQGTDASIFSLCMSFENKGIKYES